MATATETDTLSLPTSTAPTDFSESTCMPKSSHPIFASHAAPAPSSPSPHPASSAAWDTQILLPGLPHPPVPQFNGVPGAAFGAAGAWPPVAMDECSEVSSQPSSSQGSGTGCFNDGGVLYRAQAEKECREGPGKSVEEACKRSLEHFPCPGVVFPMPALDFDFRIAVRLNREPCHAGAGDAKEITTVAAGVWSGSFGHGRVLAGGYDLGQARGFRPMRLVEGAFVVQTSDESPAVLEMRTRGSLSGPSDILDALLSPRSPKDIDPRRYGFRMFATIKTADKRYAEIVNCGLWVASGAWRGEHLVIDAYRVT